MIDSDIWKHILCCKSYVRESKHLAEAIANLAKRLCSESVHRDCLKEFIAGRLIPYIPFQPLQTPANLFVSNSESDLFALDSEEGCTQEDVTAMAIYSVGIKPLVTDLANTCCSSENCKQSCFLSIKRKIRWYTDDSAASERLRYIRQ